MAQQASGFAPLADVPQAHLMHPVEYSQSPIRAKCQGVCISRKKLLAQFLASLQVPLTQGHIITGRQCRAPIGKEGQAGDPIGMPFKMADGLPVGHVPQDQAIIVRAGEGRLAIRAKG